MHSIGDLGIVHINMLKEEMFVLTINSKLLNAKTNEVKSKNTNSL